MVSNNSTQMALNTYYNAVSQVQQLAGPYSATATDTSGNNGNGQLPINQSTDAYYQQPWWNPDSYNQNPYGYPPYYDPRFDPNMGDGYDGSGSPPIDNNPGGNPGTGGADPTVEELLARIQMLEAELAQHEGSVDQQAAEYVLEHFDEIDGGNGFLNDDELLRAADMVEAQGNYEVANALRKMKDRKKDIAYLKGELGFWDLDQHKEHDISKADLEILIDDLEDGKTFNDIADREKGDRKWNPFNWG